VKLFKLPPFFQAGLIYVAACIALTAGLAVAPGRAAAQEPAAAAAPGPAGTAAAPHESGPSEEEQQVQAFRLEGPVVKWTAKTAHLSIERTAVIYEIVNFLIIVLAVGIPLLRWLPRYLRNRNETLRNDIEKARKVTDDANSRLSAVEAKLASLGDEIQKFRAEVEAESLADEKRIKASIGEESARIVEAAEQEIGQAAAQARRGLRSYAADLAIDQAANKLVLTAETDRALIAEFVGDVVRGGGKK
jgi:F-type H+-transporting ATPase subunit b